MHDLDKYGGGLPEMVDWLALYNIEVQERNDQTRKVTRGSVPMKGSKRGGRNRTLGNK